MRFPLSSVKDAITPDFLKKAKEGVLLIRDEKEGTSRLGWIKEAVLLGEGVRIELGLTVARGRGESDWVRLDSYVFEAPDLSTGLALKIADDGLNCPATPERPNFIIFPPSAIPAKHARNHDTLAGYSGILD